MEDRRFGVLPSEDDPAFELMSGFPAQWWFLAWDFWCPHWCHSLGPCLCHDLWNSILAAARNENISEARAVSLLERNTHQLWWGLRLCFSAEVRRTTTSSWCSQASSDKFGSPAARSAADGSSPRSLHLQPRLYHSGEPVAAITEERLIAAVDLFAAGDYEHHGALSASQRGQARDHHLSEHFFECPEWAATVSLRDAFHCCRNYHR